VSSDFQQLSVVPLGAGSARTVPLPSGISVSDGMPNWHPDGRRLVTVGRRPGEAARAWLVDAETGAGEPFGPPGAGWTTFTPPPVSADGKYVVLVDASGAPRLWPLDGGEPRPIAGVTADDQILAFTEDDRALFVAGRAVPVIIERLDLASGRRTPWLNVSPADKAGIRYELATITPDGGYWAVSTARLFTDLYVVDGLR
jgi:hypothetical protein